jgi:chemotaxis protein CheD
LITVGIAEFAASNDPAETLATYGLGSCIAVSIYDPGARVGGLLHFMLPESDLDSVRGRSEPCLFADTGMALLLRRTAELGASRQRMIVRAAGGAQVMDESGFFNIGKKNKEGLEKALVGAGLRIHGSSIGGTSSRSVRLELATGMFLMREGSGPYQALPPSP